MARATKKLLQVVIMEPLPCMREGLKAALERSGDYAVVVDVGDAGALKEALAGRAAPDLALVDVSDGASDGFGALGWLQAEWPELRCVAYSLPAHDGAIVRAYRGGARALLSKDMTTALLMRALEIVRETGVYHTPETQRVLLENPEGLSPEERLRRRVLDQLGERYLQVLQLICHSDNPTYGAIAADLHVSIRTVEGYAARLFEIFGVNSKTALLQAAIRLGVIKL